MKKIKLLFLTVFALLLTVSGQTDKPVLPTKAQIDYADSEIGILIHYVLQVFEPGYKWKDFSYHPDLSIFNPKELDTDQWLRAAKAAGATYAVLVAKHCSGFSLWPTKAHPYSVKYPLAKWQGRYCQRFYRLMPKIRIKTGYLCQYHRQWLP